MREKRVICVETHLYKSCKDPAALDGCKHATAFSCTSIDEENAAQEQLGQCHHSRSPSGPSFPEDAHRDAYPVGMHGASLWLRPWQQEQNTSAWGASRTGSL